MEKERTNNGGLVIRIRAGISMAVWIALVLLKLFGLADGISWWVANSPLLFVIAVYLCAVNYYKRRNRYCEEHGIRENISIRI